MGAIDDDNNSTDIPAPTPDDFADEAAAKLDQVVATPDATYILKSEARSDLFGGFYDAIRRSDQTAFRIEFDKCDAEGATISKRFELEATMRTIFHALPASLPIHHLHLCTDLGAHSPYRFLIFPESHISIAQYLAEEEKENLTPQLMMRLAIHSFLGIRKLHKFDIIHGDIRPANMLIGQHRGNRTVKLANFEHATSANKELPKAADLGPESLLYASRGRMRNYEGSKKDDNESWSYCVAEFFHKELVPWLPANGHIAAPGEAGHQTEMLKLKRAFCSKKLWKAAREVLFPEFHQILQLLSSVKGTGEVRYDAIWACLNSANLYIEANIFGIAPWHKTNQGASTTPSPHLCTPIDVVVEHAGRDI